MHLQNAFRILLTASIVGFNTAENCIVCKPGQQKKDSNPDCYIPCENCPLGYYSTEGYTERCRPILKKSCEQDLNKITVHRGNASQNRVCGECLEGFTEDIARGDCFLQDFGNKPADHVGIDQEGVDINKPLTGVGPAPNTNTEGSYSWWHMPVVIGVGISVVIFIIVGAIITWILLKRRNNIPPQRPEDVALRADVNNDIHRDYHDVNVQIEMNNVHEGEAGNELQEEEIEQNHRLLHEDRIPADEQNDGVEGREDGIDANDRPLPQRVSAGVQPQNSIGPDEGIAIEQLRINNERQREFLLDD